MFLGRSLQRYRRRLVTRPEIGDAFTARAEQASKTSYCYALFCPALHGHNNLPDSSNMCHETTSVGLKKVISSSVGTCVYQDFNLRRHLFFGQNTGSNSPRFLHHRFRKLPSAICKIITFNRFRRGWNSSPTPEPVRC